MTNVSNCGRYNRNDDGDWDGDIIILVVAIISVIIIVIVFFVIALGGRSDDDVDCHDDGCGGVWFWSEGKE